MQCHPLTCKLANFVSLSVNFVILSLLLASSFSETDEDRLSSAKLQRLGWSYMPLEETLVDSIESYQKAGLLNGK